jgi:non-heme chloroperoxidase
MLREEIFLSVVLIPVFALVVACGGEPNRDAAANVSELASELSGAPKLKRIALSTGVELEYLEQGSKHGDPLIFLHGFTASHHHFDLNLRIFPRNFHVFALDLRGHGDSSKPECCYTQSDFAADVVAFMNALSLQRASLVGHSMGSLIAHKVAADFPSRVDKLVLLASAPTAAGHPSNAPLQALINSLVDPIDPAFVRGFEGSIFFNPVPEEFLDSATSEALKSPAAVWQQTFDGLINEDHSAELFQITAPTLIVFGDQDSVFNAADQAALDAVIPDSTLIVYSQTGHGLHVERPQRTTRDIARFLR